MSDHRKVVYGLTQEESDSVERFISLVDERHKLVSSSEKKLKHTCKELSADNDRLLKAAEAATEEGFTIASEAIRLGQECAKENTALSADLAAKEITIASQAATIAELRLIILQSIHVHSRP